MKTVSIMKQENEIIKHDQPNGLSVKDKYLLSLTQGSRVKTMSDLELADFLSTLILECRIVLGHKNLLTDKDERRFFQVKVINDL